MRVLITGAYGLIGAGCLERLRREGHDLVGAGRSIGQAQRRFPYARWVAADFNVLTTPASWHELLIRIDAVVNCVGALQDGARDDLERVHMEERRPLTLALAKRWACDASCTSPPSGLIVPGRPVRTHQGRDRETISRGGLDWVILRPGLLVLASGVYGGTAMLRGLAGIPG